MKKGIVQLHSHRSLAIAIGIVMSVGVRAHGTSVEVYPATQADMNSMRMENAPISRAEDDAVDLHITVDCYRTNLRGVANPISGDSCWTMDINTWKHGRVYVKGPAAMLYPLGSGTVNSNCSKVTYQASASKLGKVLQQGETTKEGRLWTNWVANAGEDGVYQIFALAQFTLGKSKLGANGEINNKDIPFRVASFGMSQSGISSGGYQGTAGPLTHSVSINHSPNGRLVSLYVSVPGAAEEGQGAGMGGWGFCGGAFSPLVLFFDDRRPAYTGSSSFQLAPKISSFYWPEPGAAGYFLAYDRNGDGTINDYKELFGDNTVIGGVNGFEALRPLDTDRNGTIDSRDKMFSKLLLWADKNGDGISQKSELQPLALKGVRSISLKYESGTFTPVAGGEMRERSTFVFVDLLGKDKKGQVIDVYLRPRSDLFVNLGTESLGLSDHAAAQ